MEQDISSIEKRFAYGFLQKLLKWMDIAQEFIAHLGAKARRWLFSLFSFLCVFLTVYPVSNRGRGQQRQGGEVAARTGDKVLRQGEPR